MTQSPRQSLQSLDLLLPLSPALPLLSPIFTSTLRSLSTAEYLHQPYFEVKGMSDDEVWRWVDERKWAYRGVSSFMRHELPVGLIFA